MDEIINYMDSCSVLGAEEYSFLKRKYDDEMILDSLVNVVSLKCDLIDDNESFYQFQLDLWKRYGYFFSLFRYYPFSSDILDRYESVTKNRGDDDASRISLDLEVKYGFQLLAKQYVSAIGKDFYHDILAILDDVDSSSRDYIIKIIFDYYKSCNERSYNDDKLRKYVNDHVNGLSCGDVNDNFFVQQIQMYFLYKEARYMLISHNLKLLNSVAHSFQEHYRFSFDDFYQEGYFGLVNSCDRFDIRYGYKFSTFAVSLIYQSISDFYKREFRMIKVSVHKASDYQTIYNIIRKYVLFHGEEPSISFLASESGFSEKKVSSLLVESQQLFCDSLQRSICSDGHDHSLTLEDMVEGKESLFDEAILNRSVCDDLVVLMKDILSEKEMDVFCLHHLDEKTYADIALKYQCSRQRIEQIEKRAMLKLKRSARVKKLNPY